MRTLNDMPAEASFLHGPHYRVEMLKLYQDDLDYRYCKMIGVMCDMQCTKSMIALV